MEFPVLVYQCPGLHSCAGGTFNYKSAPNEKALQELIDCGWHETLPEALGSDTKAPTREELEEKATELGIKFDGRTKDPKLAALIEAAL